MHASSPFYFVLPQFFSILFAKVMIFLGNTVCRWIFPLSKAKGFCEDEHDTLWFEDRIYVPNDPGIRKLILQEAHDSPYSIHPGNTKMYLDLKDIFWWTGMKKDIAEYVAVCDVCQRVKAEHQKPA